MADPLSSLIRPNPGPQLPAFERFAPPPPENVILAELDARTAPGDVVIDLHGRGGWVARNAIGALRRVYWCKSTALTRLLAEVVMRPPDLRHFDAGIATLATHPRGDVELRRALEQPFTSRCPTCGRPVIVEEFIWEAGAADPMAPTLKIFRCSFCKDQSRTGDLRVEPLDEQDIENAHDQDDPAAAIATLRTRFPIPRPPVGDDFVRQLTEAPLNPLPDELLNLYTPRVLIALEAIIERLDSDLRAEPVDAGMRLGLAHALLPMTRLNAYPGRVASLRIRHGHVQQPASPAWRERNPWLAFEEGCREVRGFISRVEQGAGTFQPRPGEDMESLIDGTANVVLRTGPASWAGNEPQFSSRRPVLPGRLDPRSRVRLVLTQPPVRWSVEKPRSPTSPRRWSSADKRPRACPSSGSSAHRRATTGPRRDRAAALADCRRPVLARDASAVVVLDRGGASGLVAGVLGGVGAGFRLKSALLTESGNQLSGLLEFNLGPPRDAGDGNANAELASLRPADPNKPFVWPTSRRPSPRSRSASCKRAASQPAPSGFWGRCHRAGPARPPKTSRCYSDFNEAEATATRCGHVNEAAATADSPDDDQRDDDEAYDQAGTPQAGASASIPRRRSRPHRRGSRLGAQLGVGDRPRPAPDGHRHG